MVLLFLSRIVLLLFDTVMMSNYYNIETLTVVQ